MIETAIENRVAILRLNRGVSNAINPQLVRSLSQAVAAIETDPGITALVLSSSNSKFLSIGFDIPELLEIPREGFARFLEEFDALCLTLLTFPKPVVASIPGHATAGGCILALCCDYRFISEGRKLMGLNEIKLGVPLPYPADCALRWIVGARTARDVVDSGEFFLPQELIRMGLVDQVLPGGELEGKAVEHARTIAEHAGKAFRKVKKARVEGLEAEIRLRLVEKEREFVECWYSEAARASLKEAAGKFRKPARD